MSRASSFLLASAPPTIRCICQAGKRAPIFPDNLPAVPPATSMPAAPLSAGHFNAATLCAHAGVPRRALHGAPGSKGRDTAPESHAPPLWQSSVFDFGTISDSLAALGGDGFAYRRMGNPNAEELETAVAALEGAEAGAALGSPGALSLVRMEG